MDTPRFIFLDIETTGLDSRVDQITEIAWITDTGKWRQFFIQHTVSPSAWVLDNTDYSTRIAPANKFELQSVLFLLSADCLDLALKDGGDGKKKPYLVGAAPAFDDRFLQVSYRLEIPYHYHLIDVEVMAMGLLGYDEPCSLIDLRVKLGIEGQNEKAHTALSDAKEVKLIFDTIRQIHRGRK